MKPLEKRVVSYENGKPLAQAFYRNKKREGEFTSWHENGNLWIQEFYTNGKPDGDRKVWYENGQIQGTSFFRNGLAEKERKSWRENGRMWTEEFYSRGKREGERKVWYIDGKIWVKEFYRKGNIDGELKEWYSLNGGISSHRLFRNGKCIDNSFTNRKSQTLQNLKKKLFIYSIWKKSLLNVFLVNDLSSIISGSLKRQNK